MNIKFIEIDTMQQISIKFSENKILSQLKHIIPKISKKSKYLQDFKWEPNPTDINNILINIYERKLITNKLISKNDKKIDKIINLIPPFYL